MYSFLILFYFILILIFFNIKIENCVVAYPKRPDCSSTLQIAKNNRLIVQNIQIM